MLGFVPVVLLLSAIGLGALTQRSALIDLEAYEAPLGRIATVATLIDAVDAERGASLDVHLEWGGAAPLRTANQFSPLTETVVAERVRTNEALDELSLSGLDLDLSEIHRDLNDARVTAESETVNIDRVQVVYDRLIAKTMMTLERVSPPPPSSAARAVGRYLALSRAHARASAEQRTVLGLALTESGKLNDHLESLDPAVLGDLKTNHEVELIYLREFLTDSTPSSIEPYIDAMKTPAWRTVTKLRLRLLDRPVVGAVAGAVQRTDWQVQSEARLQLLGALRDSQLVSAQTDLATAVTSTRRQLWLYATLGTLGLLLICWAANLARRSVARPLGDLNGAANAMLAGRVHPVSDEGNDELSIFARAFGKLHDQMSELWSEAQNVSHEVKAGQTGARFDSTRYQGDWQALVVGFNDTLQASEDAASRLLAESNRRRCLAEIASRAVGASSASAVATAAINELSRLPGVSRCFLCADPDVGSIDPQLARAVRVGRPETSGDLSMFTTVSGPAAPLARLVVEWTGPLDDEEWMATERTLEAAARMVSQTSRRHAAERMVQYQSNHDLETGLPTIAVFESWIEATTSNPAGWPLTVVALQLHGLSTLRGSAGQELVSVIITKSAERLRASIDADALLARASSDQFLVAVPAMEFPDRHSAALATILKAPIESGARVIDIEVTAGYAVAESPDDAPLLLQNALAAGAEATQLNGHDVVAFSPQIRNRLDRHAEIEQWFDSAINEPDRLTMWYQPIVDIEAGEIVGHEALIRGFDEDGEPLAPDEFVPVVEKTDRIHELGRFSTSRAVRDILFLPGEDTYVSVNISPQEIHRGDLVERLDQLDWSGVDRSRLAIEITEGLALIDDKPVMDLLHELRDRGHRIIIDDFGTGYSSLGYLNRLPINIVKIDRTLIKNIDTDPTQSAVAAAAIEMAHATGSTVVAEGVERGTQLEVLRSLGCDLVQGYLTGYPAPIANPPIETHVP